MTNPSLVLARYARRGRRLLAGALLHAPGTSIWWGPPRRLSESTETWARGARDTRGRPWAPRFIPVRAPEEIERTRSVILEAGIEWQDLDGNRNSRWGDSAPSVWTWPTFVADIRRGRVCGQGGAVVAPDDTLLGDASTEFVPSQKDHSLRRQLWLGRASRLDGVFGVIAANYGHVYYHWMFDVLPRVELLRLAGFEPDDLDGIIVNRLVNPFQEESLRCLGLERWVAPEHPGRFHVQAERLIVPSVAGCSGEPSTWACRFLRRSFLPSAAARPTRRIYISRSDATSRKVRNEDQLLSALGHLGVEPITLSGRTLREQAAIFASAELVVAPHGGGLTNLVFSSQEARVVEVFPRSFVNPVFWHLASVVGVAHFAVFATPVPQPTWPTPPSDDLEVDVDAVMASVYRALQAGSP